MLGFPSKSDVVPGWESDEKSVFGQSLGPKVLNKWTFFSKARVSVMVRVRVRVRVSFSRCENVHFRRTRWSKVGKVIKKVFLFNVSEWAPRCAKSGLFSKARGLGLGLAFKL